MPWKANTTMSQRQEFVEQASKDNANIRALCREFGITPRTGYKWIKRCQELGEAGLYDRSRRPKNSPRRSNALVEGAVLKVRPFWFKPELSVLFMFSAILGGISLTLFASMLSSRLTAKAKVNDGLIERLSHFVGWGLVAYFYFRF